MKRYKITLPTPDQCIALGIKYEGLETRNRLWLMGVAFGVSCGNTGAVLNLVFSTKTTVYAETNSANVIARVKDFLSGYGTTVEEVEAA